MKITGIVHCRLALFKMQILLCFVFLPSLWPNCICTVESLQRLRLGIVLTVTTAVIILGPPDAPRIIFTSPLSSVTITGVDADNGVFPGRMKFAGAAGKPSRLPPGIAKSFISLLYMIPFFGERNPPPNL